MITYYAPDGGTKWQVNLSPTLWLTDALIDWTKDSPAHRPRGARRSILWANLLVRLGLVLVMVRELMDLAAFVNIV
jgi:hypothetical protein